MISPEKILMVRFSSLGDVLLTTPFIRAVKKRFPEARADFLTKPAFSPLLKGNPHLDNVIELPTPGKLIDLRGCLDAMKAEGGYDLLLDLHDTPRSWYVSVSGVGRRVGRARRRRLKRFVLIRTGMDLYGPDPEPMAERYFTAIEGMYEPAPAPDKKGAELFPDDSHRSEARAALGGDYEYIVVAPSANWPTKRWLPEKFAEAGEKIAQKLSAKVVLAGAEEDRELARSVASMINVEAVNLAGKLSIMGTAAVMERARAFVGNDTGLMHIAGALEVPGAAVFGPTTKHLGYFPYKSNIAVVEDTTLKCRPCTKHGQMRCPKKHFKCMKNIPVDTVVEKTLQIVSSVNKKD